MVNRPSGAHTTHKHQVTKLKHCTEKEQAIRCTHQVSSAHRHQIKKQMLVHISFEWRNFVTSKFRFESQYDLNRVLRQMYQYTATFRLKIDIMHRFRTKIDDVKCISSPI
jgi:hypothetical protein